jgi:6-phospho-3-hexuloisomerase
MPRRATSDTAAIPTTSDAADARRWLQVVLGEVGAAVDAISDAQIAALDQAIRDARRVYVAGQGRSGMIGRAFAQRLRHIGLESYAVGDIISPAVGSGDLLIAITASGRTETTIRQAQKAQAAGARIAAVVQPGDGPLRNDAQLVLSIPTGTADHPSAQHSTTLFCQVVQITFDAACAMLQAQSDQTDAQLNARHSNLE